VPFKAANLLIIHLNSGASTCGGYHAYFFFFARFLLYKFHTELEKREKVEKMDFLLTKKKILLKIFHMFLDLEMSILQSAGVL
jgi:hypothetical protein